MQASGNESSPRSAKRCTHRGNDSSIPPPLVGGGEGAGFARGARQRIAEQPKPEACLSLLSRRCKDFRSRYRSAAVGLVTMGGASAGSHARLPARDPAPIPPPTRGG